MLKEFLFPIDLICLGKNALLSPFFRLTEYKIASASLGPLYDNMKHEAAIPGRTPTELVRVRASPYAFSHLRPLWTCEKARRWQNVFLNCGEEE